jgi:hypothetical protein
VSEEIGRRQLSSSSQGCSQVLRDDFYVDDLLSGTSTVQEAIEVRELSTLLDTAGFPLRKWASNNSTFLDTIPEELRETRQTLSLDNEDGVTTLGLYGTQKLMNCRCKTTIPLYIQITQ